MVKVPIRLRNMYLPKDRRNFKNMAAQSTYNIEALQANAANPKVQARLELTLPVHNDYMLYYVAWTESRGISKGATTGFRSVFAESKEKLQTWQHDVTTLYKVGSEEYVTIFPNGISDFKKGNMVERITKFNTLEESLKLYPLLNSVLVDVAKYNQKLIKAFESKGKKVKGKDVSSSELDAAHDAMGKQLFSNFLTLTDIFIDDTSIVLNYFDFNLLSSAGKKILGIEVEKLNLKPGIHKVAKTRLAADHKMLVNNKSKSTGFYFSASSADAPISPILTEIPASSKAIIQLDTEKAPENTYVIFVNTDSTKQLKLEIELQ